MRFGGPFWTLFWRFFTIFWLLAKRENSVIYNVFLLLAWKNIFLQHAENYVNTSVFARSGPKNIANTVIFATRGKKHCKYRGFGLPRCLKHWYLRCFLLRECQKNAKNTTYLTIFQGSHKCKNTIILGHVGKILMHVWVILAGCRQCKNNQKWKNIVNSDTLKGFWMSEHWKLVFWTDFMAKNM